MPVRAPRGIVHSTLLRWFTLELIDVEEHHSNTVGDAARVALLRLLPSGPGAESGSGAREVVIESLAP